MFKKIRAIAFIGPKWVSCTRRRRQSILRNVFLVKDRAVCGVQNGGFNTPSAQACGPRYIMYYVRSQSSLHPYSLQDLQIQAMWMKSFIFWDVASCTPFTCYRQCGKASVAQCYSSFLISLGLARRFSLLRIVQNRSGIHPAVGATGTKSGFPLSKVAKASSWPLSTTTIQFRVELHLESPTCLRGLVLRTSIPSPCFVFSPERVGPHSSVTWAD